MAQATLAAQQSGDVIDNEGDLKKLGPDATLKDIVEQIRLRTMVAHRRRPRSQESHS